MAAKVGAVFIVDIQSDHNAVAEAKKLGIPVVAICDTNVDPTDVNYPIPCNDDAAKAVKLVLSYVQSAIEAGQAGATKKADTPDKDESVKEA